MKKSEFVIKDKRQFPKIPKDTVDYPVFIIAAIACTCFYAPMVIFKDVASRLIPPLLNVVTGSLDWCFELIAFICVIFSLWLIFGRYSKIKLGGENAKPQFSTFTWVSMIFCAGVGAGIIYWACIEPMSYLSKPPFEITPFSNEARNWALTYTCFHWSITPWAIYAIPSVIFAYKFYNRNCGGLRASYACSGAIGKYSDGIPGKIIDIFVIIGLVGGLATSLGFVFPFISGLISNYLEIPDGLYLQVIVGLTFTGIFTFSCVKGLYSGICKLSNINTILFIVMVLFILLSGPTLWLISFITESTGNMLQNFIKMSFYLDKVGGSNFPQDWTVFYWAWQVSWSVYIGLFTARISKGRTIRSLVISLVLVAGCGTALICAIIGGYTQHVIYNLDIDLFAIAKEFGNIGAIYTMLSTLPFSKMFIPLMVVILLIAQATGIDSAAYTLSNISCKKVGQEGEPPLFIRLFWSLALFFSALALIIAGGTEAVKISAVLTSIPLLLLLLVFMFSLNRWFNEDGLK
ncbi:MAG TPA: choline/carnitine/betaine transporter [Clostridium sp.]|jgi:BCCT family betaine/carnitine transporter|nr:choline/carnitine/betaine transporter [Clostridium sp.]